MTTPAEAIKMYFDLRDNRLETLKKTYTAAKNEIEDAMAVLEGFFLKTMQDRGETQLKTAEGVAFPSLQKRVKMVDRGAFLDYCVVNRNFDMITNHVAKDAAIALAEAGHPPPGLEITEFITCNVRKA